MGRASQVATCNPGMEAGCGPWAVVRRKERRPRRTQSCTRTPGSLACLGACRASKTDPDKGKKRRHEEEDSGTGAGNGGKESEQDPASATNDRVGTV
ncbi:MAG: hypothetical protein WDW36_007480 [Sanguina aurantia]